MKTIRYILLTLAAATFVAACSEELNPNEINKANPGDEVQFSLSLPGKTKTVYGDETANEDGTNPRFPIYWVNGDKVKVASPQCQSGRNNAEYSVSVKTATQNYATALTKTGDYGVQWGSEETAVFYSIYPSTAGTALNINRETVTATLHVDATQFANTSSKIDAYKNEYIYAQPAEMGNVVMYAKATASKTDEAVKLHYTPFSTVIEFDLTAPDKSDSQHQTEIIIQSITLVAPQGITIAGDFTFNFPNTEDESEENDNPSATAYEGGNNTITLHFLDNNQYTTKLSTLVRTLKAKMCVMPIGGVENLDGWKVEVATSAGTFSKTLTDQTGELKPGLVHKIKLPELNYAKSEWEYIPGEWIPSLPDYENIYLSELSLPGAWYAGTPLSSNTAENYQSTESIKDLWNAGIRAFAVESKTITPERTGFIIHSYYENPVGVAISGTQGNGVSKSTGTNSLNTSASGYGYVSYIQSSTKKIETLIAEIANQVTDDEYAVLVLSYADGGSSGLRYVDFGAWLYLLYDAYNKLSDDIKRKIYNKEITPNTTIKDVLGKLILKINVDKNIAMWGKVGSYSYTYENNLPALFSYNPFLNTTQMSASDFATPCYSDLYWSNWSDSETTHRKYSQLTSGMDATGKFMWVFSSANRTDCTGRANSNGVVTLSQRQTALSAMMDYSKKIYEASTHNVWFYFNCGGTSTTETSGTGNALAFASDMNGWLLNEINSKTEPSPLGIVMFNQCTSDTYNGPAIIKAIIEMNSRFYLKHAGTSGGNTGGSTGGSEENTAQNDSSFEDGGEMF